MNRLRSVDAKLVAFGVLHDDEVAAVVGHGPENPPPQAHDSLGFLVNFSPLARPRGRRAYVEVDPVLYHLRFRDALEEERRSHPVRVHKPAYGVEILLADLTGRQGRWEIRGPVAQHCGPEGPQ